jgi:hypothetical protein
MPRYYVGTRGTQRGVYGAFDHTLDVIEIPASATADTERTVVYRGMKCTSPIEMKNDQRERHGYTTLAALMMMWSEIQPGTTRIKEQQRIRINDRDNYEYLIRKVKYWPNDTPIFIEIHVEDEGA